MTQKRYIDYGASADTQKIKAILQGLFSPGIIKGGDIAVSASNTIYINPVTVLFADGILMEEDSIQALTLPSTSSPKDYTVYYKHKDADFIGGIPATLEYMENIVESIEDGIILAYIKGVSNSIITKDMIYNTPRSFVNNNFDDKVASFKDPFSDGVYYDSTKGVTKEIEYSGIVNSKFIVETNSTDPFLYFNIYSEDMPRYFQISLKLPSMGQFVKLYLTDENENKLDIDTNDSFIYEKNNNVLTYRGFSDLSELTFFIKNSVNNIKRMTLCIVYNKHQAYTDVDGLIMYSVDVFKENKI